MPAPDFIPETVLVVLHTDLFFSVLLSDLGERRIPQHVIVNVKMTPFSALLWSSCVYPHPIAEVPTPKSTPTFITKVNISD